TDQVSQDTEDNTSRAPTNEEDGRGIAAVGGHCFAVWADAGSWLEELLHGRPAGDVEQLLIHRIEQPTESGHGEYKPVIAVEQPPPRPAIVSIFLRLAGFYRFHEG